MERRLLNCTSVRVTESCHVEAAGVDGVAVFLLQPPPDPGSPVQLSPVGARDSTLALVRHTVASRLFAADLLARHLSFCSALARSTTVRRLSYPWEAESSSRIAEAIAADLGRL